MIEVRRYGSGGPTVMMLHGGPGAPGYMAPVALELRQCERCGHHPWLEQHARDDFYATLRGWLGAYAATTTDRGPAQ